MLEGAVHSHIITSRHGAPLMIERDAGLIVEVTDGDTLGHRGNFFYDPAKNAVIRLAYAMAADLRAHLVTALAITPGFLRSEAVLDTFGVTEANWRDAIEKAPYFAESETPCLVGRAVAALAADPNVGRKSGGLFSSWMLSKEYGTSDVDGSRPDWALSSRARCRRSSTRTSRRRWTSSSPVLDSTRRSLIRPRPLKPRAFGPGSPVTTEERASVSAVDTRW